MSNKAPNLFGQSGWQLPRHLENLLTDPPPPPRQKVNKPTTAIDYRPGRGGRELHDFVQKLEHEIKKPLPEKPKPKIKRKDPEAKKLQDAFVPQPQAALPDGRRVCQHGGEYIHDIPRCGICLGERRGQNADESFGLFLESLQSVAKRVAHLAKWSAGGMPSMMDYKDRYSECFSLLLSPATLKRISTAKSPIAMATDIAKKRFKNAFRDPFYKQTRAFSQMPEVYDKDGKKMSLDERVARTSQAARTLDRRAKGSDVYFEAPDDDDGPGSFKLFPGFWILWTRENVRRLVSLMKEGLSKLPRYPYCVSLMITMHHGALPNEPYTWAELAEYASKSCGKEVTVNEIRYAVAKGEESVRDHILKSKATISENVSC